MTIRSRESKAFYKWKDSVNYLLNIQEGYELLDKRVNRHRRGAMFKKWKNQIKNVKRFEHVQTLLDSHSNQRNNICKREVYEAWLRHIDNRRRAKRNVRKALVGW